MQIEYRTSPCPRCAAMDDSLQPGTVTQTGWWTPHMVDGPPDRWEQGDADVDPWGPCDACDGGAHDAPWTPDEEAALEAHAGDWTDEPVEEQDPADYFDDRHPVRDF